MKKANLEPQHHVISIDKYPDGETLKIIVELPMQFGWFERVRLNIVNAGSFDLNSVQ